MNKLSKVLYKLVYANETALNKKILDTAKDIISLEYDPTTEKELLDILENIYNEVAPEKTTADINWEQTIRQNKEKQKALKEEREEANKKVKRQYRVGYGDDYPAPSSTPIGKKIKKEIETDVRKIGNVFYVDFKAPRKEKEEIRYPGLHKDKNDKEFNDRMTRIRTSLEKINTLMQQLRQQAQEEREKKKPTRKQTLKQVPKRKPAEQPTKKRIAPKKKPPLKRAN